MNFRHEWKHEINALDAQVIRMRMRHVMQTDVHATNGSYLIRSLYFDNLTDKALREKIDGVNKREKFRMRYYNRDPSLIHLEKKSKVNGLCAKESVTITADEAEAIIRSDIAWMPKREEPLLAELYGKMRGQGIRPRTIVDYIRDPFVYAPGNVRVTLDYDIRSGMQNTDFLNPDSVTVPVCPGITILEVKWDAFLPEIIRDAVQLPNRSSGAFSKYAACRMYG